MLNDTFRRAGLLIEKWGDGPTQLTQCMMGDCLFTLQQHSSTWLTAGCFDTGGPGSVGAKVLGWNCSS